MRVLLHIFLLPAFPMEVVGMEAVGAVVDLEPLKMSHLYLKV
jgi:hypothetical protein